MIVHVAGTLVSKELDRVEIDTPSGVAYELHVPLSVFEVLPDVGQPVALHTSLVVREDSWTLYGFATVFERRVFLKVLDAKGIGPALALGMLSALSAERLVRAIRERDIAALQSVPRVGRKKAEQLILDLADKLDELQPGTTGKPRPEGAGAEDAIRALVSLGYNPVDSERAVRAALDSGGRGVATPELIRLALAKVGGR
jgi:Holliday junction DNA helicase RuvA